MATGRDIDFKLTGENMKQFDLFEYQKKEENWNSHSYDDKHLIECPWCFGLTYHTYGETEQCNVCRIEISDSDLISRVD